VFRLTKRMTFEASHQLPDHDGKCAALHGHSWTLEICFEGPSLQARGPRRGMLADFSQMGRWLDGLHQMLDHKHLNDLLPNPTSENLAVFVAEHLATYVGVKALEEEGVTLHCVSVLETCRCRCDYYPGRLSNV
jgi:6-pyruvoyltetrahydropterin/6-carboxytetrahydropterin synthase